MLHIKHVQSYKVRSRFHCTFKNSLGFTFFISDILYVGVSLIKKCKGVIIMENQQLVVKREREKKSI